MSLSLANRHTLYMYLQLSQALKEVEDLKLELVTSQESWEHEKLRLKEDMYVFVLSPFPT